MLWRPPRQKFMNSRSELFEPLLVRFNLWCLYEALLLLAHRPFTLANEFARPLSIQPLRRLYSRVPEVFNLAWDRWFRVLLVSEELSTHALCNPLWVDSRSLESLYRVRTRWYVIPKIKKIA